MAGSAKAVALPRFSIHVANFGRRVCQSVTRSNMRAIRSSFSSLHEVQEMQFAASPAKARPSIPSSAIVRTEGAFQRGMRVDRIALDGMSDRRAPVSTQEPPPLIRPVLKRAASSSTR
jgi:hypothetical protein